MGVCRSCRRCTGAGGRVGPTIPVGGEIDGARGVMTPGWGCDGTGGGRIRRSSGTGTGRDDIMP
jgi:hypothetical protein